MYLNFKYQEDEELLRNAAEGKRLRHKTNPVFQFYLEIGYMQIVQSMHSCMAKDQLLIDSS